MRQMCVWGGGGQAAVGRHHQNESLHKVSLFNVIVTSRPRLKNNPNDGFFCAYAYPAPYPEDTRSVPGSAKRWFVNRGRDLIGVPVTVAGGGRRRVGGRIAARATGPKMDSVSFAPSSCRIASEMLGSGTACERTSIWTEFRPLDGFLLAWPTDRSF